MNVKDKSVGEETAWEAEQELGDPVNQQRREVNKLSDSVAGIKFRILL
jgi:hypothetical protein